MLGYLRTIFGMKDNNYIVPVEEAIIPIKTYLGHNKIVLREDGSIEGDYKAVESWLRHTKMTAFAEDRIIFWLLLNYWRQQKEIEKYSSLLNDEPKPVTVNTVPTMAREGKPLPKAVEPTPIANQKPVAVVDKETKLYGPEIPLLEQIPVVKKTPTPKLASRFKHV